MQTLRNQSILVLGLGQSGLAMARWCHAQGAAVTVADTRDSPAALTQLRTEFPSVKFVAGAFDAALLADTAVSAVYRSPGLAPAQVAPVVDEALRRDIPVGGELDLFVCALAALHADRGYRPQVLAVTGTNGKTTVTSLTGQLVERSGRSVAVAGNIGPTLLDTLAQALVRGDLPDVWVIELSSFQLHGSRDFEPTAATVLNISQDHQDWHASMEEYCADKARIFGERAPMVLNRDDPIVMAMLPAPVRQKGGRMLIRSHVSFGLALPTRPGDFGIEEVNGMAWLVRAMESDEPARSRPAPSGEPVHLQRLMPVEALRIRGRHNAANALAALALASAAGLPLGPMLYGLREYRGEPHRVEPVGIVQDIEYFDDSKGTNVGATVAALEGLGVDRKLVVILGGDGKGQDFSPLASPVARHARSVILIGRDAPAIQAALTGSPVPLLMATTMADAVKMAAAQARAGDAVLMSPACASFDMFDNYGHRAQVFRHAVAALADAAGASLEGATA